MATTSTEPSSPSSSLSSSGGAAVGLAEALGDGAIRVAAASEMIARNENDGNDGDDGEEGGVSVAAASVTTTAAVTTSQRVVISSDAKASLRVILMKKSGL